MRDERFTQKMSDLLPKMRDWLIYHERPERIAQGRSFDMSDLSNWLTVTHLSWAIWANHSQSLIWSEGSEQMRDLSEWANLIPNHVKKLIDGKVPIFENRKKWQSLHPKSPECTVQYCRYQIIQVKNSSWSLHFCTCRWRSASNYSFFLLTEGIIIIYGRSLCFGKVADN